MHGVTSYFVIHVTICNNLFSHFVIITEWTKAHNLRLETLDPGSRIQKPGPLTKDPGYGNKNAGTEICDQVLEFIEDNVWTFLSQIIRME